MHWRDYCPVPSMPGFSEPDSVAASWRKRKRDHEDSDVLGRPYVDSLVLIVSAFALNLL